MPASPADSSCEPPSPPRFPTGAFVLLCIAGFFHNLCLQCFFHLPAYLQARGSGEFEIGSIVAVLPAVAIVVRPRVGAWIDDGGRRRVLVIGGALHAIACLLYLAIPALSQSVYLARAVHGLAQATLFSALFTIAADIAPPGRRTQFFGLFGTSGMVALAFSGAIGEAILARGSYPGLFIATSLMAAVATVVTLALPSTAPAAPREQAGSVGGSFWKTMRQPDLQPLWLVGFGYSVGVASCVTFLSTWVVERQVGSMGSFFAGFGTAAVALRVLWGSLPDVWGRKRCLIPCMGSMLLSLSLLAQVTADWHVAAAGVLFGLAHGYAFPIMVSLVVERAGEERRGRSVALFTALFDAGVLIGGPALGALIEAAGYPVMFRVTAVWVAVSTVVFLLWDRRQGW